MLLQARTLGQLTGSVESRYLDTYSGILALEADKATVARLTLRTGGQAGAAEARRPPTHPGRDKREAAEERKKPPIQSQLCVYIQHVASLIINADMIGEERY